MGSDGLARALLDALPDSTAVLDHSGDILAVNRAWQMFAVDNGGRTGATGVGMNYLELCERSAADGCADAAAAAAGLRAVLDGAAVYRELEYACPSPAVDRWFLLRITPLTGDKTGAVASHVNITRRKLAERELACRAATDPLTGLANRGLLRIRLDSALARRPELVASLQVGVLYLAVDQLHGHQRQLRSRRGRRGAAHHRAPAPVGGPRDRTPWPGWPAARSPWSHRGSARPRWTRCAAGSRPRSASRT